ncbi:MAG: hypothetical protein U0168_15495 [Nannocystaceae bacterium]
MLGGRPSFIVHQSALAAALVAHDARVHLLGPKGPRSLAVTGCSRRRRSTPRASTRSPPARSSSRSSCRPPAQQRSTYAAAKEKQSHDWPLGEAAVHCRVDAGALRRAGRPGPRRADPWRARARPKAVLFEGKAPTAALFVQAADAAFAKAKPLEHNGYKIPLTKGLLRDALHRATGIPMPE